MDDSYSSGSSIMPQKKNPDMAELIRGKTGRVYGDLICLLTIMKGLPLAYNKDMQEDKEAVFDAGDTLKSCMAVFIPMLATLTVNRERLRNNLRGGFLNATDIADYLAQKGMPFRDAHEVSGRIVSYCISSGKEPEELSISEMKTFSTMLEEDIFEFIKPEVCLSRRDTEGGPSERKVREAIERGRKYVAGFEQV
jgi:argininosuccinate lyase